jgi:hypothetical protein
MTHLRHLKAFFLFLFSLLFTLCFTSFNAFAILNGTWNTHIKSTQPEQGRLASSCVYVGAGSPLNGAASFDADLMVVHFNNFKHQLWASTFYPDRPSTNCSNENLFSVARLWNVNGNQLMQTVFGIIPKLSFSSANSLDPLIQAVNIFSAEQLSLTSSASASGVPGVGLAVGADDFQSVLANILSPTRILSVKDLRDVYLNKVVPSGVRFVPYFEALNAMVFLTKSVVLGLPAGTTLDSKLYPGKTSDRDEFDFTFHFSAGSGTPISIPETTSKVVIQALIGDSYIRDATSSPEASPVIDVQLRSSSGWRSIQSETLTNPVGNSGSQFFPVNIFLNSSEILDLTLSRMLQLRFRLRNDGTKPTGMNTNALTVISVPRIIVTHKSGEDQHELHQLMDTHPGIYYSSSNITRPTGINPSVVQSRLLTEKEQLLSVTLGDALDGAMFKTDSSDVNFSGSQEVIREVCMALRARGKSCIVVAWGSDLQGISLNAGIEIKRHHQAMNYSDGYLSYNFPLDIANFSGGVFQQQVSSLPNSIRFHWPLDTRGIHGFDQSMNLKIPGSSPIGGAYELSVALTSPNFCTLNGTGDKIWSLGLRVPSHPSSDFSGGIIRDASGAVFPSHKFFPSPGDIVEIHFSLLEAVGSSRCDFEVTITPPSGYSFPSSRWNFNQENLVSPKAFQFYSCFSELFQTGTIRDMSLCNN